MKIRRVIKKPIKSKRDGLGIAGGVNAVISGNINEPGSQSVSTSSRQRIVQSSGKTEIHEEFIDTRQTEGGKDE